MNPVLYFEGNLFTTRCTKCGDITKNYDSPICEALRGKGYELLPLKSTPHLQAFRFMVGLGHCPMILKYGSSLSEAGGPVDPSFLVVKKSHFNKIIILQCVYGLHKTESTWR